MNINKVLETIKDTSRDYVGMNGCLYQDITREELDLIVNEIKRLNNIIIELSKKNRKLIEDNMRLRKEINLHGGKLYISNIEVKNVWK